MGPRSRLRGKATLLGPLLVAASENPGFSTQCIDLTLEGDAPADSSALARAVHAEIQSEIDSQIVSLGARGRLVRRLRRSHPAERSTGSRIHEGSTVLITGGLGDLALELAEGLADLGARLVLLSHRPFPSREEWPAWLEGHAAEDPTARRIQKLQNLEARGAVIEIDTADVADIEAVSAAVERAKARFGQIDGVIHAAGVTDDRLILEKTRESIDRVLAPKLQGTLVLAEALASEPLDFFLLFGSTSSMLAPAGQVDYVAATCFLNAWASEQRPDLYTAAINWGPWSQTGMAVRTANELRGGNGSIREVRRVDHPVFERLVRSESRQSALGHLSPHDHWLLSDHRTHTGLPVLPGTGHIDLFLAALSEIDRDRSFALQSLDFLTPLSVADDSGVDVRVQAEPTGDGWRLELASRPSPRSGWAVHSQCRAKVDTGSAPPPVDPLLLRKGLRPISDHRLPAAGDQSENFDFGPRWQVLRQARFGEDAVAELQLAEELAEDCEHYRAHPALLDLATGFALRMASGWSPDDELLIPLSYERIKLHDTLPSHFLSRARLTTKQEEGAVGFDVWLVATDGTILGEIEGVVFRRLTRDTPFELGVLPGAPGVDGSSQLSPSEELFLETVETGIGPSEGRSILATALSSDVHPQLYVSPLHLPDLLARSQETLESQSVVKFERPDLESELEAPRNPVEKELAALFEDLLGVARVGIRDDFFALGGHSLVAVRLFARIKKRFGVEFPLSILFEAPSVALLAERIGANQPGDSDAGGVSQFQHVVPLHQAPRSDRPPFFIVSGMLGNVLNLRYLAARLGDDQPVYALQARGLYGEAEPHRRFEDMAEAYLEEVLAVQSDGPYFLGGFSGGGLIALEMARTLEAHGQQIGLLAMLDTPAKILGLSWRDRVEIQLIKWRRGGLAYPVDFLKQRLTWERARIHERLSHPDVERSPAVFRSAQIEQAFIEALDNYETKQYSGVIHLFRPELDEAFVLSNRRTVNEALCFVRDDNHWRDFASRVEIIVVPGEHNSMVLEPHVRVLANHLREALEEAIGRWRDEAMEAEIG